MYWVWLFARLLRALELRRKILLPFALAASSGTNDDEMYPPLLGGSVVTMAVDACVDAASDYL